MPALVLCKRMFYDERISLNASMQEGWRSLASIERVILGIDPGLANTGWGVVSQSGPHLDCVAYGCVSTTSRQPLPDRLLKVHDQMNAVIRRFRPTCAGIETVWFGQNVTSAFATGQARGAALVACAEGGLSVEEFTPRQIKLSVVGTGTAEKEQVQYMVRQLLGLDDMPRPDHAADALAAAVCYTTHDGLLRQIRQDDAREHDEQTGRRSAPHAAAQQDVGTCGRVAASRS